MIRHISIWFWLATLITLPGSFVVLPRLAVWFPDTPAVVFLVAMYAVFGLGIGFMLNVAGLLRIRSLIRDAQLWERSGITTRAEKKLIRAVRLYDSAWLSVLTARRAGALLASSLARFYLASGSQRREIQGAAGAWLAANPTERTLARFWLERIQDQDISGTSIQSVLSALADQWYADPELCRMLVELFLKLGRMDFSARRLYRSFLELEGKDGFIDRRDTAHADMIREMMSARLKDAPEPVRETDVAAPDPAGLTLGDQRTGGETLRTEEKGLFAVIKERAVLADEGVPGEPDGDISAISDGRPVRRSSLLAGVREIAAGYTSSIAGRTGRAKDATLQFMQSREKLWSRVKVVIVVCMGAWLIAFVWGTFSHMFKSVEQPPARQIKVEIPKPFTIQVAAYLKQAHAERYVAELAKKGVKATTKVSKGGGKTWYLVRVSEFTDQNSAQTYGNRLKADHIIADFFVSNK